MGPLKDCVSEEHGHRMVEKLFELGDCRVSELGGGSLYLLVETKVWPSPNTFASAGCAGIK